MTPHHLAATAAGYCLADSLAALEMWAMEAVREALVGTSSIRDNGLRSPIWGGRHALGGHGDPTATTALGAWAPGGPNPHAALLGDILRQLDQAAGHLPGAPGMDPLTRIRQAIPAMSVLAATRTAEALEHLDGTVRRRLGAPSPWRHLSGRECPACQGRLLFELACAPGDRPVVCRDDCRCVGPGCGCGMPGAVEGAPHIWRRADVIGAVGGVR
ncbi:hypothetical protein AB0875_12650 [Micromonospora gifhornensis]|uniref:hypothetical protein n=1 Tax=Micromonospora gifhornensis TaxID=84594 RepID=UPI003451A10A